jgi:hypothetical protein
MNENAIHSRRFCLATVFLYVKYPHNRNKIDKRGITLKSYVEYEI